MAAEYEECSICRTGVLKEDVTHLSLYVRGSEGICVCLRCRMALTEFAKQLRDAALTSRTQGVRIGRGQRGLHSIPKKEEPEEEDGLDKEYKNKIRCRKCGDVIESTHRHDFVRCSCGAVSVDGGNDYWRVVGEPEDVERIWEERDA